MIPIGWSVSATEKNSSTLADHEQTFFEYKAVFADYNKCFEILDQAKTSVLSSLAIATSFGFQTKTPALIVDY